MKSGLDASRPAVLCPHELGATTEGARVEVGGRVLDSRGGAAVLGDAFARCEVELAEPARLPQGAWVQVRGTAHRGDGVARVTDACIVKQHAGRLFADGQFAQATRKARGLRGRATAIAGARQFFEARNYLEVTTPVRVAAPGTDVYLEPQPSGDQWLITSPEFHLKRLVVGGVPRVFEFARCTRRDEVGPWHQPEFTMLEWYCAFQDFAGLLSETEALVTHLAAALGCGAQLTVGAHTVHLNRGFERLTVADAFASFAGVRDVASLAARDEDRYFQLMVDEVDPALSRLPRPVLLTHYPLSQAALSAPSAEHAGYAERFELFIGGVELCNGYGELTCAATQRQRFEEDVRRRRDKGLPPIPMDEGLIAALEEGMPPCAGNAVGFDRLVAVLLQESMQNVVAFPVPLGF